MIVGRVAFFSLPGFYATIMRRASFHIGCASVFGLVAFVVMLVGSAFVLKGREIPQQVATFGSSQLTTIATLAAEAQRVLDECCPGDSAEDEETPEASDPT